MKREYRKAVDNAQLQIDLAILNAKRQEQLREINRASAPVESGGVKYGVFMETVIHRMIKVIEVEHIYHAYCEFVVEEIFHYKKDGIIMNYSVDNSVHINNNMNIDSGTHITGNNNITGANNTVANSFNNNDLEVIDQLIRVLRNTNEEKIEKVIKIAEELKTTPKKQKTEKIKQILKFGGKIVEVALPFLQKLLSNV